MLWPQSRHYWEAAESRSVALGEVFRSLGPWLLSGLWDPSHIPVTVWQINGFALPFIPACAPLPSLVVRIYDSLHSVIGILIL